MRLVLIEKCSSPTGDGKKDMEALKKRGYKLRNVVPRQGTESILLIFFVYSYALIEKCSSPTGDGKNTIRFYVILKRIEKCSSPTGDGNLF